MAEDTDASAGDLEAITYHTGIFNKNALIFGGSDTFDTHKVALRELNIHGKGSIDTNGVATE